VRTLLTRLALPLAALAAAGCTTFEVPDGQPSTSTTAPAPSPSAPSSSTPAPTTSTAPSSTSAPTPAAWVLGARPLPLRPDGFGEVLPTPPVLTNRSLPTPDLLPPPTDGRYAATVGPVPADVLARSTWQRGCPVPVAQLRYLTMSFWGFDGRAHTGEMIVNATVADAVTRVFATLFAQRFPLEEMRVTALPELDLHPTGDGNNTGAFVCRASTSSTSWSAHAYGLAVDVSPFCNPYRRGDLVLPELASSYVDRTWVRPGMVLRGDAVVRAFASIGWSWGGDWSSPVDIQHFTATGR